MTPQEKDHYTKLGEHYNSDRDCPTCINHTEKGCRKWDCEYEERMSIQDAILALRMVEAHGIADKAKETAIRYMIAMQNIKELIDLGGENLAVEDQAIKYRLICCIVYKALGEVGESE